MKRIILSCLLCGVILLTGCAQKDAGSTVSYENVDSINAEANAEYESGNYKEALTKYAEAITTNPVDLTAQLGAAKCQMALENYEMAAMNLSAALKIDPKAEEIYDAYLELSKASDSVGYARSAIKSAEKNQVDSFLAKLPKEPVLSSDGGTFDSKVELTITADPDEEIFVEETHDSYYNVYKYYGYPLNILHGITELSVYCMKDGIPSRSVDAHFSCSYEPTEVTFKDKAVEMLVRADLGFDENTPVTDFDCEKIQYLYAYQISSIKDWGDEEPPKVESLDDFVLFPNLSSLSLEEMSGINDFSFLANCHKLNHLDISDTGTTDLSSLSELYSLETLFVNGNEITDFSPVKDLKLDSIAFNCPENQDLSFLQNYKDSLTELLIYGCADADLSSIASLSGLTNVSLYNYYYLNNEYHRDEAPLGDLHWLVELPALEYLQLYGLEDYSPLEYIKTISTLQRLNVRTVDGEDMSAELRKELEEALPGCKIYN